MSFQSVLHDINLGLKAAAPLAPLINTVPIAGTVFGALVNGVAVAETIADNAAMPRDSKKAAAMALVKSQYPGIDDAKLSQAVDAIVTTLNLLDAAMAKK
jgi:hypothetical protein